ncbi:MAG TPA: hypothetical protein VJT82_08760 [Pyrinomonadaceae bacterium]|nr:hypothetical protein [Pyrinomonadaceae bacterium]
MSAREQDPVRSIAERIASRLEKGDGRENAAPAQTADSANVGDELAALRAGLSEMQQRLTQIESHVVAKAQPSDRSADDMRGQQPSQTRPPQAERAAQPANSSMPSHWLSGTYVPAVHPSEERFGIDEAVSELVEFFEREKVCNVEPGGKPCDHCGMCSSRGF